MKYNIVTLKEGNILQIFGSLCIKLTYGSPESIIVINIGLFLFGIQYPE
jgi:hypothetical protein